jgi:multiple sugar transport system substrate-binding protein
MRRLFHVIVAVGLLVACGGDDPDTAGPSEAGGGELEFTMFGDPAETAGYQDMVDAFTDANPDVNVTLAPVATQDDLMARLTTSFAGGEPPDVFLINYRRFGQFADQGVLEPVQSYLDESDAIAESDFAETSLTAFRFGGEELTCLPQNTSSLVVYYNVDLFEAAGLDAPQAGWTWDDFLAAAQALTEGDTYGLGTEASLIRVAPFVWSNGGEIVDDPEQPTTLTLDEGPAREALDFFLDLQLEHGVVPPDAEEQSQESEVRFIEGKLGMYLNSRRVVPGLREIESFEWDVAPLPIAPGGEPATILHGDAYCMAADGDTEAAWRLIEFANSVQGQEILAESGRTVPSRLDVAESDVFLEPSAPPASSKVFVDVIPHIRTVPVTATWIQVEGEADSLLEQLYYGRVDRDEGIRQLIETTKPLFGGG